MRLQAQSLGAQLPSGQRLFRHLNIELESGQSLGILGPNGAGKSSFLRVLAGFLCPSEGQILLNHRPLSEWSVQERAQCMAWVNPREVQPSFTLSVSDYVRLGRAPWQNWLGHWQTSDQQAFERALYLSGVEALLKQPLQQLSSGEWQKVQLARALTQEPQILLLDEPTSHLDLGAQIELMRQLCGLCQSGLILICVVHDLNLAAQYMEQILLLHQGQAQASGSPGVVLTSAHLEAVYGVSVDVKRHHDKPLIVPHYG